MQKNICLYRHGGDNYIIDSFLKFISVTEKTEKKNCVIEKMDARVFQDAFVKEV